MDPAARAEGGAMRPASIGEAAAAVVAGVVVFGIVAVANLAWYAAIAWVCGWALGIGR
jgi:uncharacterized membrane protein